MLEASVDPWSICMGWCPEVPALRLVAPGATWVDVVCRDHPEGQQQQTLSMVEVRVGERVFWELRGMLPLPYYRFMVHKFHRTLEIADPWSHAVVRQKLPGHPTWSVALPVPEPSDWVDPGVTLHPEEAVIVEIHVGDQTRHPSAGVTRPGTYEALTEGSRGQRVAMGQLLSLGANAVELLPVTSWPCLEDEGGVNHWGYMPSFLCAPSGRYMPEWLSASLGSWPAIDEWGRYLDPGQALKTLVHRMHDDGVAVILDLVYNHVSAHDQNPLTLLDPGGWFRRDAQGRLLSYSGCGNDLNTGHPEMRALVLHSFRRWLEEYRIDGVRLDLAELIDDETLRQMVSIARELRPDFLLIAEPWSFRAHRAVEIATMGFIVWNDRCRDGIKGRDPLGERGAAFGEGGDELGAWRQELKIVLGGCSEEVGGHLPQVSRSLNYLESHDDSTFGDFVRLATGQVASGEIVRRSEVAEISGRALSIHKLATALLLSCRGPVMLAQGQCWGRAKVASELGPGHGPLCANTYDRNDDTNALDWGERDLNGELLHWHQRLVAWRRAHLVPAFLEGATQAFIEGDCGRSLGYEIVEITEENQEKMGIGARWVVLFNAELEHASTFTLRGRSWMSYLGQAIVTPWTEDRSQISLGPLSSAILRLGPESQASGLR